MNMETTSSGYEFVISLTASDTTATPSGIQQAWAMITAGAGRDLHSMNIGIRPESTANDRQ